jgi:hypothetical protein
MAFWIKWEKGLARKQEVLQIAARLQIPPTQAAGTLMQVMEWLDDNVTVMSHDGHAHVTLKSLSVSFIDSIAGVVGYGEAMVDVGWLRVENGILTFVNAGRHNGNSAKNRMLASDRKRAERSRKCHDPKVTKKRPLSSLLLSSNSGSEKGVKGDETTVIPLLLSTDDFRDEWAAWQKHRSEKKDPIRPGSQAEKMQLKKLEEWGIERAIAAIRHSIRNDYKGIFEPTDRERLAATGVHGKRSSMAD